MIELLEKVLISKHGLFATFVAGFGGLFSDALLGTNGFIITLFIAFIILFLGVRKENDVANLYNNEVIPIPIIVSIDDNTPIKMLFNSLLSKIIEEDKRFKNLIDRLEKYFNISKNMLTYKYEGDLYDNARLISFLQIIRYELNDIQFRLDNKAQFHILYLRRPAYGFALGGMFRSDGIIVYQNNDYKNTLDKVAVINSRQYKEKISKYEKFEIIKDFNNKENKKLTIIIQISSHEISVKNKSFNNVENIMIIRSKGNGTISTDKIDVDNGIWIEYSQEIYNVINKIKSDFDEITIIHSMPEAITVIVGMALENYWNIDIYQFDDSVYKKVINLKQIKYYF
jgi:hypothetical protein